LVSSESAGPRFEKALAAASGWLLYLIGEDQPIRLARLIRELVRGADTSGRGKRILPAYAYQGVGPTIAWCNACDDRMYPVMRQGIQSFSDRWSKLAPSVGDVAYHYVSLGPGNGDKDRIAITHLAARNPQFCYVPVDASAEMLQQAVQQILRVVPGMDSARILPIQLDFSDIDNLSVLRQVLTSSLDSEPLVVGLLGNTLATFDDDLVLLRSIRDYLLLPDDRLVLDMATSRRLDETAAGQASDEYRDSLLFREFATSSLQHYTDLAVDIDSVSFVGEIDPDRSLKVRVIYRNETGSEIRIMLPNRTVVKFPANDTIRLALTRKYYLEIVESLVCRQGLRIIEAVHEESTSARQSFGLSVMLMARDKQVAEPTTAATIWAVRSRSAGA